MASLTPRETFYHTILLITELTVSPFLK